MSNVSISEENSVSSGRLGDGITAKEQKAAKTIAFDLQMTASSSGLLLRNSDPSPPPQSPSGKFGFLISGWGETA